MEIDRINNISVDAFVESYMTSNRPAIVEGALESWKIEARWGPEHLEKLVGARRVQVYNNYFDLQDDPTLSTFLRNEFYRDEPDPRRTRPYVRWYTKLRNVDLEWADEVFALLANNWNLLSFLPRCDYVLPHAPGPALIDPRSALFPAKGLFISGRGARTSLHVDPWGSDAILCQLYGKKRWTMYDPSQAPLLIKDGKCVNLDAVDEAAFPRFAEARPTFEFQVQPGEVVYVPHGWFHHVVTETPSISLTWNFVHASTADAFLGWLQTEDPSSIDSEIVRFFCNNACGSELRDQVLGVQQAFRSTQR